jgi:hypothetical protein
MLLGVSASVFVHLCGWRWYYYVLCCVHIISILCVCMSAENAIASWGYLDGETKSNMTNSGLGGLQPRGTLVEGNWVHEVRPSCCVYQD